MQIEKLVGAYLCTGENFMGVFIQDDFGNLVQIKLGSVTFFSLFGTGVYPSVFRSKDCHHEN